MRIQESEKTFLRAKARSILYLPAACMMLYAVYAYGETKSVTVTFGSHAYQTFTTTQPGENHGLNINKATAAPNIARSLITAQDTQDQVIWQPAQITTAASTHTYTMSGAALDEPLWVEIEGTFVKAGGGGGGTGAQKPDFEVTIIKVDLKEVSFSGTKYHTVKKDDGSQDYTAPTGRTIPRRLMVMPTTQATRSIRFASPGIPR